MTHDVCRIDRDSDLVLSAHLVSSRFLGDLFQGDETLARRDEWILNDGSEMS